MPFNVTQRARRCFCIAIVFAWLGSLAASSGCNDDSIVIHENVSATRVIDKFRMITAITKAGEATWFFKAAGPADSIEDLQPTWTQFVDSIRFESPDEPTWTTPDSWSTDGFQQNSIGMRIANLDCGDPSVTISISSLFGNQSMLANINRWRGQLGLDGASESELAASLSDYENESVTFVIFDQVGSQLNVGGMGGRAPFAGRGKQPERPQPAASANPHGGTNVLPDRGSNAGQPDEQTDLEFQGPKDWVAGKTSSMVLGRWNKTDEGSAESSTELMLMVMIDTDDSWKANVEAWARQVKMTSSPEIDQVTEEVEIAGVKARRVQLSGPGEDPALNPVVIGYAFSKPGQGSDTGYLIKLSGEQVSVNAVESELASFLNSIKFLNP